MTAAIKWAGKSRDKIEGLLAPYGGPVAGKDLDGEFFTADTDFALDWFGDWERPLLYHHGLDANIKSSVVGRIKVSPTEKGLWMQAQLDQAHEYYDAIAGLVDQKALGLSSGSVAHLVQTDAKSGEIKSWPLIEGSLTPTPANPAAQAGYSIKAADAVEHLAVLGVEAPDSIKVVVEHAKADAREAAAKAEWRAGQTVTVKSEAAEPEAAPADEPEAAPEQSEDAATEEQIDAAGAVKSALIEAVKSVLTPQALHDAAVASGAACAPSETKAEPAPLLAIAGKSAEPPAVDLEALQARLSAKAVAVAREMLDR